MLKDHRLEVESRALQRRRRKKLAHAFGDFIAGVAPWDWFINPITFRDGWRPSECRRGLTNPGTPPILRKKRVEERFRIGNYAVYGPDPRIEQYRPSSRNNVSSGAPVPDAAIAFIQEYFALLQAAADGPIGWMIAEEFGRLGGRWHCHALVTGVSKLRRTEWWRKAYQLFGRSRTCLLASRVRIPPPPPTFPKGTSDALSYYKSVPFVIRNKNTTCVGRSRT